MHIIYLLVLNKLIQMAKCRWVNLDWLEAGIADLDPATETKRIVLIQHKRKLTPKTLEDSFQGCLQQVYEHQDWCINKQTSTHPHEKT